jgi:hypothetical protein
MIRSYFPDLTADQVKQVLVSSVTHVKQKVILPGTEKKKVKFKKLCKSGGIVNAYNAVQEAMKLSASEQKTVGQR